MLFGRKRTTLLDPDETLDGREEAISVPSSHQVLGTSMTPPWPDGHEVAYLAMGCFWGAERIFWQLTGVHTTAVGYLGGSTTNPTYEEVCSGRTNHAEAVLVVHDPQVLSYEAILRHFWEQHDPTQQMRQGNDVGTQYRSGLYPTTDAQMAAAQASRDRYQAALSEHGHGQIATEIVAAEEAGDGTWYYAEAYHQQYLAKNPNGYCNHGFCQVAYDEEAHGQGAAQAELPAT